MRPTCRAGLLRAWCGSISLDGPTERNARSAATMDRRLPVHGSLLAMTRYVSGFHGLSRAASGRTAPVPRQVGHRSVNSHVHAGEVRELLAGYLSYSAVGPC